MRALVRFTYGYHSWRRGGTEGLSTQVIKVCVNNPSAQFFEYNLPISFDTTQSKRDRQGGVHMKISIGCLVKLSQRLVFLFSFASIAFQSRIAASCPRKNSVTGLFSMIKWLISRYVPLLFPSHTINPSVAFSAIAISFWR